MSDLVNISEASKILGVNPRTLKRWDNEGKLKVYRTLGKHRRYKLSDIEVFLNGNVKLIENKKVFVYCRVSTRKQQESGNLERQKERLTNYSKEKGYTILHVYEEVASGLNDTRRELTKMFSRINEANAIVIEYNDRLARFGFNYIKEFLKAFNVEIEAVEQKTKLEPNEEMVNDLISIVTCFSARLYGARGGKKIKQTLLELEKERSENIENNNTSSP